MNMQNQFTPLKLITATLLIAFGCVGRLVIDMPNIETITVVSLLAGVLLGGMWTIVVGLAVVAITDMVLGNTNILFYTWAAWAVMGFFGWSLRKRKGSALERSLELTGMGVLGNVFFYIFTNFGVWHIGGLYPHTWEGLVNCYIAGIPFMKYQLVSTLLFVPTVSFVAFKIWAHAPTWLAGRSSVKKEHYESLT